MESGNGVVVWRSQVSEASDQSPLEKGAEEGDSPVHGCLSERTTDILNESSCLGLQLKAGGKFHLKLNIGGRPIANKYCEGKMKRTLKRELKVPELAEMEK